MCQEMLDKSTYRAIREWRGLTLRQVAERLAGLGFSYSHQAVAYWEDHDPPARVLPALAKIYEVSLDELFAEEVNEVINDSS